MASVMHVPNADRMIDDYIAQAQPFAREICTKIREIILKADPVIIEDWKWGPNYYKDGMMCGFGAFKQHVHLVFFRGDAMKDPKKLFIHGEQNRHNRGIKFTDVGQIDERVLTAYVREAVAINEKGIQLKPKSLSLPADFRKALSQHRKAKEFFDTSSHTNRKEYINWILSARKNETRRRRLAESIRKLSKRQKFS
ncbi:MAG: YdeI/OmpD-associated family protein [Ignavibacteriales bacterium]|nr:YdeI/OmpD-associated family protein [Ignavibacteriales bacterium]